MSERTRSDIRAEYAQNKAHIEALEARNIELLKESLLLSDDERWYKEERGMLLELAPPENGKRRKRIEVPHLLGRVHWNETFYDEDTGQGVTIERSRIVKIDGEWYNDGFGHRI